MGTFIFGVITHSIVFIILGIFIWKKDLSHTFIPKSRINYEKTKETSKLVGLYLIFGGSGFIIPLLLAIKLENVYVFGPYLAIIIAGAFIVRINILNTHDQQHPDA